MEQYRPSLAPRTQRRSQNLCSDVARISLIFFSFCLFYPKSLSEWIKSTIFANANHIKLNMEYGIVYLLTNPYMPGLVKIGMTKQEDLEKRMKELYTTGVPVAFECQFACKVNNKDCAKIERALHTDQGEEVSISALSAQLKGYKVKHIQPTPHWLYKDRLLSDIYDETYPFEE